MKTKKKNRAPLSHSNLTEHENLRSHYDPNGSWTGTPDGWDKDIPSVENSAKDDRATEGGQDVYGDFKPTENGYVQSADGKSELEDGITEGGIEVANEFSSVAEYPLEGQVAPYGGDSYEQNTRNMQDHDYPHHTDTNGMAETEAGGDMYTPRVQGENGEYEKQAIDKLAPARDDVYDNQAPMKLDAECGSDSYYEAKNVDAECGKDIECQGDVESGDDIYQNDIEFDPSDYERGDWKKHPEECPSPKRDVEIATDFYALGDVGIPVSANGYPSVPDGELTMEQAGVREDVVPVQDADDL